MSGNSDYLIYWAHCMGWADIKYLCGVVGHEITEGAADIDADSKGWTIRSPFCWPCTGEGGATSDNNELCDYCNRPDKANAGGGSGETFTVNDPFFGGPVTSAGVGTFTNGAFGCAYWDDNAGGCRAPGSSDANLIRPKANQIRTASPGKFLANAKLIWIFWGSQWKTQTTPSKANILRNFSLLEQTQYYDSLQQYNMSKPTYFLDVIYDDPNYQPEVNYRLWTRELVPSENPNNAKNVMTVIVNCIRQGLVPTPNYKGLGTQEQFIYIVMAPQGFISDGVDHMGAGAHMTPLISNEPNRWNVGTGGGGGGGGGGFTAVYDTTTDTFASDYWDLDGTAATRAGEVFETGEIIYLFIYLFIYLSTYIIHYASSKR